MTIVDDVAQHHILRERIDAAERVRKHELEQAAQSEATIWKDYGSQTTDYGLAFPEFLRRAGVENFEDFLLQLKQVNHWKKIHVLDVAAPIASFVGRLSTIDSGMAITLTDTRTIQQKQHDATHHRFLVEGNLFQRRTWHSVRDVMQQNKVSAIQFIIARPYAGLVDRVDEVVNAQFCLSILRRLYHLLSADNGVLITEVPYFPQQEQYFPEYIQHLNAHHITAIYQQPDSERHYGYRYALMLTRSRTSPKTMPAIN